jgi:DNA-binding LacI/PurR family transcriptional regulator
MSKQRSATKYVRAPRTPIYRQIEADLRTKVRDGFWLPGAMLPSRKALADEYNVDLRTLQNAIAPLLADGALRADNRRGTFVPRGSDAARAEMERSRQAVAQSLQVSLARRARTGATLGIVAIGAPISDYFNNPGHFPNWSLGLIRSVEQVFSDAGGATLFQSRHDENNKVVLTITQAVGQMLDNGAKALALMNAVNDPLFMDEIAACVNQARVPTVMIGWQEMIGPVPHVITDDGSGGYQASMHLLASGYMPRIAIDPYQTAWSRQRIAGARAALMHGGLPTDTLLMNPFSGVPEGSRIAAEDRDEAAAHALALKAFEQPWPEATGVVAVNDTAAFGVMRAAGELGLVIGRDIGLVGFDDTYQSAALGLTSLRPPFEDIGAEVGRMLLRALDGQKIPHQVRMSPKLLARSSTQRVGG